MIAEPELTEVVTRAKALLGITDTAQDAAVTEMAKSAAGLVENYLNHMAFKSNVVYQTFMENTPLFLSAWPVIAVTEVKIDERVYAATDYILDTVAGIIYSKGLPFDFEVAKVTFSGGYASPLPIWLVEATAMTTVSLFNMSGDGAASAGAVEGGGALRAETLVGVVKFDYDTNSLASLSAGDEFGAIPQGAISLLKPYRENTFR